MSDEEYAAYAKGSPKTISNFTPRPCRPLLSTMLSPDPAKRADIETVLRDSWVRGLDVCQDVREPKHTHPHLQTRRQQLKRQFS